MPKSRDWDAAPPVLGFGIGKSSWDPKIWDSGIAVSDGDAQSF